MHIVMTSRIAAALLAVSAVLGLAAPASAGEIFALTASNVSFDIPSPLFTSTTVSGYLELSNSVVPGGSFGPNQLEKFVFDLGGYAFTAADLDPTLPIDVDGRVSADGKSIDFLSIGYDLKPSFPGCSFVCAGFFGIAQSQQSNFVVADDPDAATLGLLLFDASFNRIPEPMTLSLFGAGLLGAAAMRRRRKAGSVADQM